MSTIGAALDREWRQMRSHLPHYHRPSTATTPEDTMPLALVTSIEQDLKNAGHDVSDVLHGILARHLTVGNVLAHAGQWAQAAEASPILQAVERYALGPAGEQLVATWVEDVSGLLTAQGTTAAPVAAPEPQPEPATAP